jgi:hypothetical protein
MLAKSPLSGPDIAAALGTKVIPSILKDEGVRTDKPRIKRVLPEGKTRGCTYELTQAGREDLTKGLVDANAAPACAAGTPWPE